MTDRDYDAEFERAAAEVQAKRSAGRPPQEGDTSVGTDGGTVVFWRGRWLGSEVARSLGWRRAAPANDHEDDWGVSLDGLERPLNEFVSPFAWGDGPSAIPRRQWVYGRHYIRKFVSATFSPGGVGKSSLVITEAMAMASNRRLLGPSPGQRYRVAYWNGEDPLEETQRRVFGAALHHGLKPHDLEGFLFLGSGREAELVIAEQRSSGTTILTPNVEMVLDTIRRLELDVIIVDPFVSSHRVTENDNNAIDMVVKAWGKIADQTNTAIELVHHTRKANGAETTVEDGRGASALLYAARSARALNAMTKEEAERAGVERHRAYFRVDNGKANLAPPPEGSDWFHMVSVDLDILIKKGLVKTKTGPIAANSATTPYAKKAAADLGVAARTVRQDLRRGKKITPDVLAEIYTLTYPTKSLGSRLMANSRMSMIF
jgi:hypothetical protein